MILSAVTEPTRIDLLIVKCRPADPATVRRVAEQLVVDGRLQAHWGAWTGERYYDAAR